ncbi:MAG: hypothetical protein GQ531_07385 [Sulfurovum sp.]|nr:hypothetical protein [Sulfurovum sp.]
MKHFKILITFLLFFTLFTPTLHAMPDEQMKKILGMTQNSWVSFRDFNGKQLIYFTHLEAYTCGIKEVHYSINSDTLDKVWTLAPCKSDGISTIKKDLIMLRLELGTAKSIDVQLTFIDGTKSEILHKKP